MTSFAPPVEGVKNVQSNTQTFVHGPKEEGYTSLGSGTLYIAESRLSWVADGGQGFSLEYPSISLHAVSRDTTSFSHECLYLMVEGNLHGSDDATRNEDDDDNEDDDSIFTEFRFVPPDKGTLEAMFQSMSECQALHPDEDDSNSEEDDYYGEEAAGEDVELSSRGQANLERLGNIFQVGSGDSATQPNQVNGHGQGTAEEAMDVGQFEDAEDMAE